MLAHMTMPLPTVVDSRGGPAEVARVLLLLQAGFALVAMIGEIALMASPLYAIAPIAKAAFLLVLARKVATRRWAMVTTIIVQLVSALGFWLSTLIGLLPQLDRTFTLVGLLTEIGIPVALIVLCAQLLSATPRRIKKQVIA